MTTETAQQMIDRAASILREAREEAAAIALVIHQRHGRPLQTVCREIAETAGEPDSWIALRSAAVRLRDKTAGQDEEKADRARAASIRSVKSVLRSGDVNAARALLNDPDVLHTLSEAIADDPNANRAISQAKAERVGPRSEHYDDITFKPNHDNDALRHVTALNRLLNLRDGGEWEPEAITRLAIIVLGTRIAATDPAATDWDAELAALIGAEQ